jgi:predicted RNase H-like nuclease (RuvC/YqgF family)
MGRGVIPISPSDRDEKLCLVPLSTYDKLRAKSADLQRTQELLIRHIKELKENITELDKKVEKLKQAILAFEKEMEEEEW